MGELEELRSRHINMCQMSEEWRENPSGALSPKGETTTVYPVIDPVNADFYVDSWESDRPEVASVVYGFIQASEVGTAIITYRINNNTEEETQTIEKQIFIEVKSPIELRTVYRFNAPAVGYMLSTPILYLLTSVGCSVLLSCTCSLLLALLSSSMKCRTRTRCNAGLSRWFSTTATAPHSQL